VTVTSLCQRYGVTPAGFYAWRRRPASRHTERDHVLSAAVTRVFAAHHERYGSPRIHRVLKAEGWIVSRRRVARLMQCAGLRAKAVRGYRAKAQVRRLFARHPNRVWTTHVDRPDQVWVGDSTYLKVAQGWRYLAIVMDQHTRRILAWSLTRQRTAAVTCAVLSEAARRRPAAAAGGAIFHSDRGSEYMGAPFCTRVAALGLTQSASVRGPGDNAHAESFFHSLKAELIRGTSFATEAALRGALRTYMTYYNTVRMHSSLSYRSPLAFEHHAP
jgi:transposase InsO family protein